MDVVGELAISRNDPVRVAPVYSYPNARATWSKIKRRPESKRIRSVGVSRGSPETRIETRGTRLTMLDAAGLPLSN